MHRDRREHLSRYLLGVQETCQESSQRGRNGPQVVVLEAQHGLPDGALHEELGAYTVDGQRQFEATGARVSVCDGLGTDQVAGGDQLGDGVDAGGAEEVSLSVAVHALVGIQAVQRRRRHSGDAQK